VYLPASDKEVREVVKSAPEVVKGTGSVLDDIDIVILDMVMPGVGGGEAFDRLKEIDPSVRVLLASGFAVDGEAAQILERGCNGFIQKPFDMKELAEKVEEIMNMA